MDIVSPNKTPAKAGAAVPFRLSDSHRFPGSDGEIVSLAQRAGITLNGQNAVT